MKWIGKIALAAAVALTGTLLMPASPAVAQPACALDILSPDAEQTMLGPLPVERFTARDHFHCSDLQPNSVYLVAMETYDVAHEGVDVLEGVWMQEQFFAVDADGNLDGDFFPSWIGASEPLNTPNSMVAVNQIPGLNTVGVSLARIDYFSH
jgi:hypothetical protein